MRLAYADPPYLGLCSAYDHDHGVDGRCWDDVDTHRALIDRLVDEYPDGWALSMSSVHLKVLLPLCPEDVRVAAWVKPFASFKPGVAPAYAWEPVIFHRSAPADRTRPSGRDFIAEPIRMQAGFFGAKPLAFCQWVLQLLDYRPGDELDDLYPGTGVMAEAVDIANDVYPNESLFGGAA